MTHELYHSRYTWWMPLPPTFLVATLIAWQLWMRYYRLSSTSRTIMLVAFSLMQASILYDIGIQQLQSNTTITHHSLMVT